MHTHSVKTAEAHDINDAHDKSHMPFKKTERDLSGTIKLYELKPNKWCKVVQVGGDDALRRRLLDMGITPNTKVLLRKTAPLGDPIEIHLRGYDLSIRKDDASGVLVLAE